VNDDLCQNPEVVIRIYPPGSLFEALVPSTDMQFGRVEAVEFQQAIPPIYQEVYPQPGRYNPVLRKSLNDFLAFWLRNLRSQGHRLVEEKGGAESRNEADPKLTATLIDRSNETS
jgi:hypothetical protein